MSERLRYLFERYINKTSTASEETELMGLGLEEEKQDQLKELIHAVWNEAEQAGEMPDEKSEEILNGIFPKPVSNVRRMKPIAIGWKKIAVAASILLVVGLGSYLFFSRQDRKSESRQDNKVATNDVKAPESNRAMITLADGRQVYLDEVGNGELALQGNVKLVKLANGQIAYSREDGKTGSQELVYNTLSNPRGSKVIDMTLSDGSHVWLNAGSSVTYPVAFVGSERKVSITGEAYFEVNSQLSMMNGERMPFIVSKGGMGVTVLGTHFNVNAYDDEDVIKVTLLEGSVSVSNNQSSLIIKPNQQALVRGNTAIGLNNNVDVEAVIAWKNGFFSFDNSDLQTVMKQISRWYDVDVVYEDKVPDMRFGGEISRSSTAAQVLKILEKSKVQFRIEGKKIVIKK